MTWCTCIQEVNEQLAKDNLQLSTTIPLRVGVPARIVIPVEKLDSKKKAHKITLTGSFCPFCGQPRENETKS
jgi:hypothetical protein